MTRLEKWLLRLSIFLVPTNLAYHWYINPAYINGHLVDYLLPKLYLSDLPVLGLIVIYLFNIFRYKHYINYNHYLCLVIVYLFVISSFSVNPLSSLWYAIKVLELLLFGSYLIHTYTRFDFIRIIRLPLAVTLLFQSIVGLVQFINQRSVFGYYFFGESDLAHTGIATTNYFGRLLQPPYGTTAHPNILAGYIVISLLLLLNSFYSPRPAKFAESADEVVPFSLRTQKSLIQWLSTILISFSISLSIVVLILTQSLAAIGALIIISILYAVNKYIGNKCIIVPFSIAICSSLIMSPLFVSVGYHSSLQSDNQSFSQRYELNQVAFRLIQSHPLVGIGPNLFTDYLPHVALPGQKTLLLQPVHNLLLLVLTETGVIGLFLLYLTINSLRKRLSVFLPSYLPILSLVLIGSLDHYPLTLQTGQLLLCLSLVLPLLSP